MRSKEGKITSKNFSPLQTATFFIILAAWQSFSSPTFAETLFFTSVILYRPLVKHFLTKYVFWDGRESKVS